MRSYAATAVLGSLLLAAGGQAQSLAEHAAAASGATIGTAAGKPLSNAITTIFGNTDKAAQKAANQKVESKTVTKPELPAPSQLPTIAPSAGQGPEPGSASGSSTPARHGGFSKRPPVAEYAPIPPLAPLAAEPEVVQRKEPTLEEFASIQVGASEEQLFTALGQPESKVTIPDDEHLIQICQYWAAGKQLGTVRLDNGQVVSVQTRN